MKIFEGGVSKYKSNESVADYLRDCNHLREVTNRVVLKRNHRSPFSFLYDGRVVLKVTSRVVLFSFLYDNNPKE